MIYELFLTRYAPGYCMINRIILNAEGGFGGGIDDHKLCQGERHRLHEAFHEPRHQHSL